jgi:hypothetical protein
MTQNIIAFPATQAARDLRSLLTKVEAYQLGVRKFAAHMTPVEFVVFMNILDRTIGWGEAEAHFTNQALRTGDKVYGGMSGIGRTTLFDTLAALTRKGFIVRRYDPNKRDRVYYSVNLDWVAVPPASTLSCVATPSGRADYPVRESGLPRPGERTTPSGRADPIYR